MNDRIGVCFSHRTISVGRWCAEIRPDTNSPQHDPRGAPSTYHHSGRSTIVCRRLLVLVFRFSLSVFLFSFSSILGFEMFQCYHECKMPVFSRSKQRFIFCLIDRHPFSFTIFAFCIQNVVFDLIHFIWYNWLVHSRFSLIYSTYFNLFSFFVLFASHRWNELLWWLAMFTQNGNSRRKEGGSSINMTKKWVAEWNTRKRINDRRERS